MFDSVIRRCQYHLGRNMHIIRGPLSGVGMTIYSVRHITTYRYRQSVAFGEHRMMLSPRADHDQRLIDLNLDIDPQPSEVRWSRDVFGNRVAIARFTGNAAKLRFESVMRIEHSLSEFVADDIEERARAFPFIYPEEELPHLAHFIERQSADADGKLGQWAHSFVRADGTTRTYDLLVDMTQGIHERFKYTTRHEKGVQDPLGTLESGSGSCRDMAMLMIEAARSLGLAARFVSGYLYVKKQARARGGNTHAWAQVYLPGCGWVDFDPSSGAVGNRGLVRVAVAREPRQVIPLHGVWFGSPGDDLGMKVEVRVSSSSALKSEHEAPLLTDFDQDELPVLMPASRMSA
jgi:transglutaminase-like putative cysteine protease